MSQDPEQPGTGAPGTSVGDSTCSWMYLICKTTEFLGGWWQRGRWGPGGRCVWEVQDCRTIGWRCEPHLKSVRLHDLTLESGLCLTMTWTTVKAAPAAGEPWPWSLHQANHLLALTSGSDLSALRGPSAPGGLHYRRLAVAAAALKLADGTRLPQKSSQFRLQPPRISLMFPRGAVKFSDNSQNKINFNTFSCKNNKC